MEEITWKLEAALSTQTLAAQGVLVLLHGDGADAATTITDELGNTWTAAGNAQIDTAQWKYRSIGSAILFDGTGDSISTPDAAKWAHAGAFTIDFYVRFDAFPTDTNAMYFYSQYVDADNSIRFFLYNDGGTYKWKFIQEESGVETISVVVAAATLATATWYHVALVRSGNDFKVFQDGTQCGSTVTDSTAIANLAAALVVGESFDGWLAEYRVSSFAAWTAAFTPPSKTYSATSPVWTDITDDVLPEYGIEWQDGIMSVHPTNLLANPGWISFVLDNSPANSGGLAGYYTPGHANCRAGFAKNIQIRFSILYGSTRYYQGVYWLQKPIPTAGLFGEQVTNCKATDWLELMINQPLPSIPVQTTVRADQLIDILLTYVSTWPEAVQYETADSTLDSAFDIDDVSRDKVYTVLSKIVRSEFGMIFLQSDLYTGGVLTFQNRNYRAANVTSLGTITNTMASVEILDDADQVADQVKVTITPREVDASEVVLATLNYKLYLGPGESRSFTLNYRDPSGGSAISGSGILDQVANTDFKFGSSEGTASDLNASLTIVRDRTGGNSTDFTVTNGNATTGGYINLFQLRGLGIYPYDRYTIVAGTEDKRVTELDMPYQTDPLVADAVCYFLESVMSDNSRRGAVVSYRANNDATLMTAALTGTISSRWTLVETQTALAADWFVNSRRGKIGLGGQFDMEWMIVPASGLAVWVLDTSVLETDTRLAV